MGTKATKVDQNLDIKLYTDPTKMEGLDKIEGLQTSYHNHNVYDTGYFLTWITDVWCLFYYSFLYVTHI